MGTDVYNNQEEEKRIDEIAGEIQKLAHDDILLHLRFFDIALMKLKFQKKARIMCMATDGEMVYYDPLYVVQTYKEDPVYIMRVYLHLLLHCIFSHNFQYGKLEGELWDMASDMAVEHVILSMKLEKAGLYTDPDAERKLKVMREDAGGLTAEKIYRYYRNNPPSEREKAEYERVFRRDRHTLWKPSGQQEMTISENDWKKISERIKADLKSFTKSKTGSEALEKNLWEATRERYDYGEILKRFCVTGEDIKVNDDEFDYIFYTYGLNLYGNLPLVEPLEYKEDHRIREFVIAIDTSASCRGSIVRAFLQKTYSILKSRENFFAKINVHIIQCDAEVERDTKITCDEDFDLFLRNEKLTGFGATDFRPVFQYVDRLREEGEFEDLKGLIYFTDGYGIYPERMPDYDVIFAFLEEDENRPAVPPWSLKVIIESEEMEDEH